VKFVAASVIVHVLALLVLLRAPREVASPPGHVEVEDDSVLFIARVTVDPTAMWFVHARDAAGLARRSGLERDLDISLPAGAR
jgi:hypothetical protein